MERKTSRNLYLAAIILSIVGIVLTFVAGGAAMFTLNPDGSLNMGTGAGLGVLVIVAAVLFIVASILGFIAWLGALIKTARLGQWLWFVLVLLLSWTGIMMLVYIFAGPTKPKAAVV